MLLEVPYGEVDAVLPEGLVVVPYVDPLWPDVPADPALP